MPLSLVSSHVRCGCRALNLCLAAKQEVEACNLHPVTAGSLPLAAQADQLHKPLRPASLLGCGSSPVLHVRTLHALADQGIKVLLRISQLPERGSHICCCVHPHEATNASPCCSACSTTGRRLGLTMES